MRTIQKQFLPSQILIFVLVVALVLFSLSMRIWLLGHDLPYYSKDENDIVEPALAFVAGDWDPRWYKYGPLYSYLLAIVYSVQQWFLVTFLDWTSDKFFYAAFFDPSSFYYIARSFHLLIVGLIALVLVKFCWRYYDRETAMVAMVFAIAPVIETITSYTVRIDTLQGLLALVCLYYAVNFKANEKFNKSYIMAGIFAGLVFAVKPLTGMLLLPAVFVAHLFTCSCDNSFNISQSIKQLFYNNKGIYIFLLTLVLGHSLVHPYSVIKFSVFWQEQYHIIFTQADQGGFTPGYNFLWLFERWGFLLALLALISPLLIMFRRDRVTAVLVTYVMTFVLVFIFFDTRDYWYIPIIPALLIVMAKIFTLGFNFVGKNIGIGWVKTREFCLLLAVLFVLSPVIGMWLAANTYMYIKRADQVAQEWVESNLSSGSRLLTVGFYSSTLPRLRAAEAISQARWADYMMYYRNRNRGWSDRFLQAHKQMLENNGPVYDIYNIRKDYYVNENQKDASSAQVNDIFSKDMVLLAKNKNADFIITASTKNYVGNWESSNDVELIRSFNQVNGYRGAEVKIYHVK